MALYLSGCVLFMVRLGTEGLRKMVKGVKVASEYYQILKSLANATDIHSCVYDISKGGQRRSKTKVLWSTLLKRPHPRNIWMNEWNSYAKSNRFQKSINHKFHSRLRMMMIKRHIPIKWRSRQKREGEEPNQNNENSPEELNMQDARGEYYKTIINTRAIKYYRSQFMECLRLIFLISLWNGNEEKQHIAKESTRRRFRSRGQ